MSLRLVTWNLQGTRGIDAAAIAASVSSLHPTLVLVQEVQRRQARDIARAASHDLRRWTFKHWPVRQPSEGLATLLAPSGVASGVPTVSVDSTTISRGYWPWQWQRRVAQCVTFDGLRIVNTHLGTGSDGADRAEQVQRILAKWPTVDVIAGDLNEWDGPALDALRRAGFRDAWADVAGSAPCNTNWSIEDRTAPPDQRLDWVWCRDAVNVDDADLGDWRITAPLSDHVPLAVTVSKRMK